jgi:arabinogalactan oligomer / maltooligosaccharide transport system substrate-binding protein
MRQNFRALAAVAGVALLTTACGGGGEGAAAPSASEPDVAGTADTGVPERADAELVIWTDGLKVDAVTEVANAFEEANGITVAVQVVAEDLQANFVTADAAGNGPDVVVGAHDWIGNMVQNGAIEPLQVTPDQLSGYSDVAVQATTYNEQLYGLPYGVEALALYRNTDLVPEAPQTLDDAIAAGQAVVDAGEAESALNLPVGDVGDAYHMQPLLTSMGGYVFGQNPQGDYDPADLGLDSEGAIAAAQKIAELGESGSGVLRRSISGDNSIALFTDGQAPFLVSGPWALADVDAAGFGYEIPPIPGFAGAEPAKPFMGAQAFYVAANGQNKAFAQEFVTNHVNSEEQMQVMFDLAQLPPAMTAVREAVAADNPNVETFATAAEGGDPMPAIPPMQAVFEPLGQAYAAIVGGADPAETMRTTAETIRAAIGG